ncbi:hypothetical protein FQR65_LT13838 [Abscondita terminalis]|nr:hypothetical protein FQR65_LT13838 [Abscondita terminalis]
MEVLVPIFIVKVDQKKFWQDMLNIGERSYFRTRLLHIGQLRRHNIGHKWNSSDRPKG